jgi:hypothetical protein
MCVMYTAGSFKFCGLHYAITANQATQLNHAVDLRLQSDCGADLLFVLEGTGIAVGTLQRNVVQGNTS